MFTLLQLIVRRSLRNAPLTLAVLTGLLVLVTLVVAAPLYTTALADAGLQSALEAAPLDQRSVRIWRPADRLQREQYANLSQAIGAASMEAAWLKPQTLSVIRTKRLVLQGNDTKRRLTLTEAEAAAPNLQVVDGRLPQTGAPDQPVEVVVGTETAERFELSVGDPVPLAESPSGPAVVQAIVVGVAEMADRSGVFWQSGLLDLQPIFTEQQRVGWPALVNRPKLILADEPTGQLDSNTGREVISLMRRMVDEQALTLLVVTHDPLVVEAADVVYELRDGKLVA
ncbi:MAG: hypothetical protein M3R24_36965 [Chloroflexota bacterium]|nr:hypothetical protein [Chloroflexota bacterium]